MKQPNEKQKLAIKHFYNLRKNTGQKRFYLSFKMGLGKTYTAIWTMMLFKVNSYFVVTKASLAKQWKKSLTELYTQHNIDKQIEMLDKPNSHLNLNISDNTIYLLSYDRMIKIIEHNPKLTNLNIILDEAQILKSHKSKISKTFLSINSKINFLLMLSGSLISNDLDQLYTQWVLLSNPLEKVYWTNWTKKYFKIYQSKWSNFVVGELLPDASDELLKPFYDYGYFMDNDFKHQVHYYNIKSKEMFKMPSSVLKDKVILSEDNKHIKLLDSPLIMAQSVKMLLSGILYMNKIDEDVSNKLNNFYANNSSGHISDTLSTDSISETKEVVRFNTLKLDLLHQVLSQNPNDNFLVFHQYIGEIEDIENIAKLHNYEVFYINGTSNQVDKAKQHLGKKLIIAQYEAGSVGIDGLQNDWHKMIFYSITYSSEKYLQAIGRLNRIGQSRDVFVYHLINSKVEEKILKQLKQGKSYSDLLFAKDISDIKNDNYIDKVYELENNW